MWINYPHMPTGTKGTKAVYEQVIAFGKKHNILIVNDNPYSFILNEEPLSILSIDGAKDIALELNSLSKTFNMAGWRVGMVCGSAENISNVLKVKSNMDSGMFYGIQKGAIKALQLSNDWYTYINGIYAKRRELIWQLADKLGVVYDKNSCGMFVWAKLPDNVDTAEGFIDDLLYNKSIFITPGSIFGNNGDRYVRFSLCVKEQQIEEAIGRI